MSKRVREMIHLPRARRPVWVYVVSVLFISHQFTFARGASRRFITPAFRGRGYGSSSSDEVSKRITIGKDGYIYIAGTTTLKDAKEEAWGEADSTEKTGGSDVFIAKLAPSGSLKWVRRIGSTRDDFLNDLKLHKDSLYLCGTTSGDLGGAVNGSSDAFIMKFSTNGEKRWKRAFQFGSTEGDSCKGLDVDETTGFIYAVGSTEGNMFESPLQPVRGTHEFVARLTESKSENGDVEITKGSQRQSSSSSSTDAVVVTKHHLMCMTTAWNSTGEPKERVVTYLSRFDRDTLHLHRLDTVNPKGQDNFHGLSMDAVVQTGNAFIVGTTNFEDGRRGYYALAYSPLASGGAGGVLWETFLGFASHNLKVKYHSPAIAVDPGRGMVYVAGTEEGIFFSDSNEPAGIMVLPFFEVNMTNGVIIQKWQRATPLSTNRQELTDLAHNERGAVMFTGLWNEGPNETTQALVGSYGSIASRTDGVRLGDPDVLASSHDEDTNVLVDYSLVFLIVGLGLSTLFLLAVGIAKCRSRRAQTYHQINATELMEDDVVVQKKLAADSYRAKSTPTIEVDEVVVNPGTNKQ